MKITVSSSSYELPVVVVVLVDNTQRFESSIRKRPSIDALLKKINNIVDKRLGHSLTSTLNEHVTWDLHTFATTVSPLDRAAKALSNCFY